MLQAVAPSFKACSSAMEKQLLEDVLFANTVHAPLRLAASQVLTLLPKATGFDLKSTLLWLRCNVYILIDARSRLIARSQDSNRFCPHVINLYLYLCKF